MLSSLLKPEILELVRAREWSVLRDVLSDWPAQEVADLILELEKDERVLLFRGLSRDRKSVV